MIPLHHWYSSCSLLVWTPTSKSSKEPLVRILYTGACPQTLVFEALARGRHLEFLHECPQQPPTIRAGSARPSSSGHATAAVKPPVQKPKPTVPLANGEPAKNPPRPSVSKPKTSTAVPVKPRSAPTTTAKKVMQVDFLLMNTISFDLPDVGAFDEGVDEREGERSGE